MFIGKVIGTITDIDGSIQNVGVDCGSQGLQQIPYEQLVIQGDIVIFIPKWRVDSQILLRDKDLTLRRLKALIDIVSENDDMKEDAEIIHEKYKSKLASLDEAEKQIKAKLEARLAEIEDQIKAAKTILFDAKIQYKSDEISETTFETVKLCIFDMIKHLSHESAEISNIQKRITDLNEAQHATDPKQKHQESAVSYLDSSNQELVHTTLPEAPTHPPGTTRSIESEVSANFPEPPQKETQATSDKRSDESDRLA